MFTVRLHSRHMHELYVGMNHQLMVSCRRSGEDAGWANVRSAADHCSPQPAASIEAEWPRQSYSKTPCGHVDRYSLNSATHQYYLIAQFLNLLLTTLYSRCECTCCEGTALPCLVHLRAIDHHRMKSAAAHHDSDDETDVGDDDCAHWVRNLLLSHSFSPSCPPHFVSVMSTHTAQQVDIMHRTTHSAYRMVSHSLHSHTAHTCSYAQTRAEPPFLLHMLPDGRIRAFVLRSNPGNQDGGCAVRTAR